MTSAAILRAVATTATAPARRWWDSAWLWSALAVVATAPFLAASIPPLEDFLGHVGRYHVMLDGAHSPYLQRYYAFHWRLVGNLGVDLLMLVVGPVLGVERGAWLIAALTHSAMVMGIFAVSRTVHGRVQPTAFLALPFVYATAFELGFLNYDLGAALALLALALWIGLSPRPRLRAAVFVPIALVVWVCHAAAWGVLGLLAAGYELQGSVRTRGWRPAALGRAALRLAPLTPPALLSLLTLPTGVAPAVIAGPPTSAMGYALRKMFIVVFQLGDRSYALDVVSVLLIWAVFTYASVRGAKTSAALAAPAALVGLATLLVPPIVGGIALADLRLAPVAAIAFILSLRSESIRRASWAAAFGLVLTAVRLTVTAAGWHADNTAYQRHLLALAKVPMGARILVLVPTEGGVTPQGSPPLRHLADLALVRRDAFVNTQFAIAGAQLLEIKANGTSYRADPSQFVPSDKVSQALASAPLNHFNFVWVLGRYLPGPTPSQLTMAYADDKTRLFRVAGYRRAPRKGANT